MIQFNGVDSGKITYMYATVFILNGIYSAVSHLFGTNY